jgi:hypothetical protein
MRSTIAAKAASVEEMRRGYGLPCGRIQLHNARVNGVPGDTSCAMAWFKPKSKEERRFYLLPGQGGRALYRKRKLILRWSVAAGILVSAALAFILYYLNTNHPR